MPVAQSLNGKDTGAIINYGADIQAKMAKYSDNFLTQVRSHDAGEIGQHITGLLSEIQEIDIDKLDSSGFKSILKRIPIIKSIVFNVKKMYQQYDKVSVNVDKICRKIDEGRVNSLKDNAELQTIFNKNTEFIKESEVLIAAGYAQLDALKANLVQMRIDKQGIDDIEVADMEEFINRLDKRLSDMCIVRMIMVQSLYQIRIVQNNNVSVAEKAQSILTTTIPVWKNQLTIAVALERQKANSEVQRRVTDATNDILIKNANMLHSNSIAVARESERSVVSIETLRQTTQKLIETVNEVKRIHEEGTVNREAMKTEMVKLEEELKKTAAK